MEAKSRSSAIEDLSSNCIRCGFCLESCPTFLITGDETQSPRGRIALAQSAARGKIEWSEARSAIEKCLGCRACETACPSGVKYGPLYELARESIEQARPDRKANLFLWAATHPTVTKLGRLLGVPLLRKRTNLTWKTTDTSPIESNSANQGNVALHVSCGMADLFPEALDSARRLLRLAGWEPVDVAACCGALAAHNGHLREGTKLAKSFGEQASSTPLISASAGCGAWLKECGVPLSDLSEFLCSSTLESKLRSAAPTRVTATYHDACHLAHVQGIRKQPRELLSMIPGLTLVEMKEADMCCGSAGLYHLLNPEMARVLAARKLANIRETGADYVVLGNPGCHQWISTNAGANPKIVHLAEFLDRAISGELG